MIIAVRCDDNVGGIVGGISVDAAASLSMEDHNGCARTPHGTYQANLVGDWTNNGGNTVADDCPNDCPGDFDGSGTVDVSDLLLVIGSWGDPYDVGDLLLVISEWGNSCS